MKVDLVKSDPQTDARALAPASAARRRIWLASFFRLPASYPAMAVDAIGAALVVTSVARLAPTEILVLF